MRQVMTLLCCRNRPRSTLIGSRDKLCCNPTVRAHPGGAGNQMCRKLVATRSCGW